MQSPEREAQILEEVGEGGFSSSEFELLAELGRLSYVSFCICLDIDGSLAPWKSHAHHEQFMSSAQMSCCAAAQSAPSLFFIRLIREFVGSTLGKGAIATQLGPLCPSPDLT